MSAATTMMMLPAVAGGGGNPLETVLVWLTAHPLLPLTYLLFLAVSWNKIGGGFGVVDLFWNQTWRKQLLIGLVTGALVGELLYVRYLLRTDDFRVFQAFPSLFPWLDEHDPNQQPVRAMGSFLFALYPLLLLLLWVPALWNKKPGLGIPLLAGLAGSVAVAILVVWAVYRYQILPDLFETTFLNRLFPEDLADIQLHQLASVFVVLFVVLFLLSSLLYEAGVQTPVFSTACVLAVGHGIYGAVIFYLPGIQLLLFLLLFVWILLANRRIDKQRIPGLEDQYGRPVPLDSQGSPGEAIDLIDSAQMLRAWSSHSRPEGSPKPKLVVVAAAGGGIQAAVWTCAVLEELHAQRPDLFPGDIRIITGASGGMVGAALYVASLEAGEGPFLAKGIRAGSTHPLARAMARDSLSAVIARMVLGDLPALLWPGPVNHDRGRTLENRWEKNTADRAKQSPLALPLRQLAAAEKAGRRPSLIFSPMLVEDARRLLISNLDLGEICTAGPRRHPSEPPSPRYSVSAVEFFKLFRNVPHIDQFKVTTAARLNASFPFVSPAVFLPTEPPRRPVDAGYYDNYGVDVGAGWLYRYREDILRHTSGVLFLQARGFPSEVERNHVEDGPKLDTGPWAGLRWLTAPALGVLNMREKSPWYRNDEGLQSLADEFGGQSGHPDFFRSAVVEYDEDGALSWYMADQQLAHMLSQCPTKVGEMLADLKAWFQSS